MRILIIRHGEPNYALDSLTKKGFYEAELLSRKLVGEHIDKIYLSPLGRAQRTADPTIKKTGLTAQVLPWLREFPGGVNHPYATRLHESTRCPWNMPPQMWTDVPGIFDNERWRGAPFYEGTDIPETYEAICASFDAFLAEHGYVREGQLFHIRPGFEDSTETVAFFCHLGLGCALLAHLMHVSLPALWHSIFLPTSSVTTVLMERHLDAPVAHARLVGIGDTGHLFAAGEPVSPSGLHETEIR